MPLLKEQLKLFAVNPIFLSCVCSWCCAQFIKTLLALLYNRVKSLPELIEMMFWRTGGLPSSHSAIVTALCTAIGFSDGINSSTFVLALCFCLVVIRDAVGVRRASGIQAKKLNQIGLTLKERDVCDYSPVKEVHGHTPLEVIVGIVLGFSIALAFSLLK